MNKESEMSKKYVVIFQGRSGSKYLHELMSLHSEIEAYTEVFHERKKRYNSSSQVMRKLDSLFSDKVSGFQFRFPRHFNEFPEVVKWMEENSHDLKVIFLHRDNKLKAAISQENVKSLKEEYGRPHLRRNDERSSKKITVDVEQVVDQTLRREVLHKKYSRWVKSKFDHLFISYEDLCDDRERELERLLEFFDLPKDKYLQVLGDYESNLVKAVSNHISDAVDNYDELVEKCREAGVEKYLER